MTGLLGFGSRARVLLFASVALAAVLAFAAASPAYAAKSTAKVGYITDFGKGSNDTCGPGCGSSIWVNALTGSPPNGTYTTADSSKTISITDVSVSTIDTVGEVALAPFDTLILYEMCDFGAHPKTASALNTFLTNGGKLVIYDADKCFGSSAADYSSFLFPFSTSSPGPQGASGSYTTVVSSSLTKGLSVGPQPNDSVGDANIFTSFSGAWCASITATNVLGANGFVESTARTSSGGLVIYEGEDNWYTDGAIPHLRQVFDNIIEQNWAPDGLPCTIPASGISLSPDNQTQTVGGTATLTARVVDINGKGQAGVTVKFTVGSGPNAGKTSTAVTDSNGDAGFSYSGTQTGTDAVTATFVDSQETTHTSNTANVQWVAPADAPITSQGANINGVEGASITGASVASFSDPDSSAKTSDYSASINWGDGTTSSGTISGSPSKFTVNGTHTYAEEGSFHATVTIKDNDGSGNNATVTDTATVADAALHASGVVPSLSGTTASGQVATFTDSDPGGTVSDYTASINWGDGTTTTGTVSKTSSGFAVSGSHTYGKSGTYTITTTIKDAGGSSAKATVTISAQVKAAKAKRGSAHLAAVPNACVRGSFTMQIRGSQIASVRVTLDGRAEHARVMRRGHVYSARIAVSPGGHTVTVHVKFKAASKTKPRTLHRAVAGCALPAFTG